MSCHPKVDAALLPSHKLRSQTDQVTALESGLPLCPSINHPSMWTLMVMALIKTTPGKVGVRCAETGVTMRAQLTGS